MEHSWPPRRSVIVPDDDSFLLGGSCATMADSRFEHSNIDRKGFNMFSRSTLLIAAVAALSVSTTAHAQSPRGTAEVTIAGKSVTIDYGRPSLRGRDMLGKAPAGTVWRTGADAATMFTTEADLTSGGKTPGGLLHPVHETRRRQDVASRRQYPDGAVGHKPRRELGPHRGPAHVGAGGLKRRAVHHRVG